MKLEFYDVHGKMLYSVAQDALYEPVGGGPPAIQGYPEIPNDVVERAEWVRVIRPGERPKVMNVKEEPWSLLGWTTEKKWTWTKI